MSKFFNWFREYFTREEVEPFKPEDDVFVQRMKREREASQERVKDRGEHRSDWLDTPLASRFKPPSQTGGGQR